MNRAEAVMTIRRTLGAVQKDYAPQHLGELVSEALTGLSKQSMAAYKAWDTIRAGKKHKKCYASKCLK